MRPPHTMTKKTVPPRAETGMENRHASPPIRLLLLAALLLCIGHTASAQRGSSPLPAQPTGFVTDEAGLLSATERQALEVKLSAFRDSTSTVIAIAILESLRSLPPEEVATTLFNTWRIWEGDRYNGALIMVSMQEREMRIEIGYGLEGAIPDALAGRIIQEILIPEFRAGSYASGLEKATDRLMAAAQGEYAADDDTPPATLSDLIVVILFFIFLAIIVVVLVIRKISQIDPNSIVIDSSGSHSWNRGPRGRSGYRGGFGGGGGFSGTGGGYGGGGGFGGFRGGGGFGSGGAGAGGRW